MAFSMFSKKKDGGGGKDSGASEKAFKRDPRKARRFFEHAQTVADARNYDYAVDCYINGLRHDPDNMSKHEALREVSLKRKVSGGKPAGFGEKMKSGGSNAVDKMLHAERLLAMEPLSVKLMRDVMKHAVKADEDNEDLTLGEVAYWIGSMLIERNAQEKKPDKGLFVEARDLFARIGAFDKAVEACKLAVQYDPSDTDLLAALKDLEAERTMDAGSYGSGKEGGSMSAVRDADQQRALEQQDQIHKTSSVKDEIIARAREAYDEDPEDLDRLAKLVDALIAKEENESEREAIELLKKAWEETGQYRYKVRMGDIQMKQINRYLRQLRQQITDDPDNDTLKEKFEETRRKQLSFELGEFEQRVKNYPTDMGLRFELGKRLFMAKQFDEAIGAFQQAKADPKHRAQSHVFLGSCYLQKGWFDEAIDTLNQGIEGHQIPDDRLALELRYLLMDALEKVARKNEDLDKAQEAQRVASNIIQTNINYRDIKQRMDGLRQWIDELKG